jgi:hypothetical protein
LSLSIAVCEVTHNGLRIGEGRALKNVNPNIVQKLIKVQMLMYFYQPCFWQYDVGGWAFIFSYRLFLKALP